ncbi:DNA polymerase III subunit epsilon [Nitrosomonas sp. JL21]|uniref:DNA polymerase III subunit epsilon n=1 Tax=Nitrosomonas sp. JL21 TaxID=153949 RepID=UPI00136A4D31|nr:DNA polymerase III subunit epsilon [Nitrosomonas sp. JL21]MBL8498946.1 DNA polymerase III subunit epsilon [Nitrosomonas sp.]MCC7091588.1 DNA polymerase III subunit epsilon [Nitrosomonas sp.]MXS76730.1 DNA polymerase III subunit epsilon [Nitrosomonas sp. JL21]
MRQIILDTETTGLEHKQGHRIVEIAAVEVSNRMLTGHHFHYYLNPGRDSDEGALQVHGLTTEFLQDKPKFIEISKEFLSFIHDAELIIHNAPFDVGFLNHELNLVNLQSLESHCRQITDTLKLAKELHPGKRNNLDALCERYSIDNSRRTLHGALLDAELLAEVYLAMTRGQESLLMDFEHTEFIHTSMTDLSHFNFRIIQATVEECAQHATVLEKIARESNQQCIWKNLDIQNPDDT